MPNDSVDSTSSAAAQDSRCTSRSLLQRARDQQPEAWQRLVRVLGHEFNNSLAPIQSIAGSLETLVMREPLPEDWREDTQRGLSIIASRSGGLSRFLGAYTQLAKLPPPQLAPMSVRDWVRQTVVMETRVAAQSGDRGRRDDRATAALAHFRDGAFHPQEHAAQENRD